jgi:Bacterial type II and III secretion system protein
MRSNYLLAAAVALGASGFGVAAAPPLPQRDLTVELRQVEEGREGGASYRAGAQVEPSLPAIKLIVRNGEKAAIRMNVAMPMQWVQSAQAASKQSGAGVSHALQWFDAGQTMTVAPRWPGGNKPAVLELDVQQASLQTQSASELPGQRRTQVSTTVTAPLAEWVTVAATGGSVQRQGSYSSASATDTRLLLQVRVLVP